jgi:hypothetical protein
MSSNLVFNMVEVYLPALYAKNPTRRVNPKRPEIPDDLLAWLQQAEMMAQMQQMQAAMGGMAPQMGAPPMGPPQGMAPPGMPPGQMPPPPLPNHDLAIDAPQQQPPPPEEIKGQIRAKLVEWSLNQLVALNDLKTESRAGILDGLVHGRGIIEVIIRQMGKVSLPASVHLSDEDLQVDPDVLHLNEGKWIAIRRRKPVYQVELDMGLPVGELSGNFTSFQQDAVQSSTPTGYDRSKDGGTCDMLEYFEVYSRMGLGAHLQGGAPEYADLLDVYGENVMLAIAPDHPFPLNLPESLFTEEGDGALPPEELDEEIKARIQWPVPTWQRPSGNPWPIRVLDFHRNPKESWPIAHTTPVLPIVKSINWVYSYMMGRVRIASRVFPVVPSDLDETVKNTILHGSDLELIEYKIIPGSPEHQKLCEFLTIPDASKDLWALLAAMIHEFEKASGVSELMLTGQTEQQMRSAAEANVKQSAMSVRPEDMANTVQDWMTGVAENEAFSLLHVMDPASIAELFGEQYQEPDEEATHPLTGDPMPPAMGKFTSLWGQLLGGQDPMEVMNYLEFDIESGSSQKKNREQQQALGQQSMQLLFGPFFQYYGKTGDPTQLNAILKLWATANDHPTPEALLFPDMRQQIAAQQQQAMMQQQAQEAAKLHQQGQKSNGQPQPQNGQQGPPQIPPPLAAALAQHHFPIPQH